MRESYFIIEIAYFYFGGDIMSGFFYPDRRAIYFSSLRDYNNPFHYLATQYEFSSAGFLSSDTYFNPNGFVDPIDDKYKQAMNILKQGIKAEQENEQAYFTNLLQDNQFKGKKFNSLRSELKTIMNKKDGNIDYIALVNLINKILLGENEYKATLRLEKTRLQELDSALENLEKELIRKGEIEIRHSALTKDKQVIVKKWRETITSKEELYEFLRGEYLEKHTFQALRKYFSNVHETIDNLASRLVNKVIQEILADKALIQKLITLYSSSKDVYDGDLTTFIINNVMLAIHKDNRIKTIVDNALNNKSSDSLIAGIIKDIDSNFETIMVRGQDSSFGRTKNGKNAVYQQKENDEKINKLAIKGEGLADDIIDALEQNQLSQNNDYFGLFDKDSPTYEPLRTLQSELQKLKAVKKNLNANEDDIAGQKNAVKKAKTKLSTAARKVIESKIKTMNEDLEQEFLRQVQQALTVIKIYISGPTYSEIIDGLRNFLYSNDIFIHSGPVNLKADSIRIRSNQVSINTKIKNSEIQGLDGLASGIVRSGAEAFYQGFSEGLPKTGQSTNFAQGKEATWEGIRQGRKQINEALKQAEKENAETAAALKKIALTMKDTIIVTETDKTFNNYFKDIGFVSGSLGGNLTTQLKNFQELFNSAGVGMSSQELEWLEVAIVNCSPHALGASKRDPIEKYLSTLAGFAVFDEGSAELALIAKTAPKDIIEEGTPRFLHLYRLDGLYYPGSYVLQRIYDQLNLTLNNILLDEIHKKTNDGAHINARASKQIIQGRYQDLGERWKATYEVARDNYTSIEVSFLSNLFDIVKQLGDKMKI